MKLLMRLSVLLTTLLLLPVVLIRAQPYANPDLNALLVPPSGCEAPCVMGLQPTLTTQAATMAYFEHAENINFVVVDEGRGVTALHWRSTVTPYSGTIYFDDGRVKEITLQGARLYEIWFALGEPDGATTMAYEMINIGQNVAFNLPYGHIEYYATHHLYVETAANCPRFWQQIVYITLRAENADGSAFPTSLADRRREICESQRVYRRLINQ